MMLRNAAFAPSAGAAVVMELTEAQVAARVIRSVTEPPNDDSDTIAAETGSDASPAAVRDETDVNPTTPGTSSFPSAPMVEMDWKPEVALGGWALLTKCEAETNPA